MKTIQGYKGTIVHLSVKRRKWRREEWARNWAAHPSSPESEEGKGEDEMCFTLEHTGRAQE